MNVEMNSKVKIVIVVAALGFFSVPAVVAQQADDISQLEQLAGKLKMATKASTTAKKRDTGKSRLGATKKQKSGAKKPVESTKNQISPLKQAIVVTQPTDEDKERVTVEAKPKVSHALSIREEAQALAKAAAQAQAAAQANIADNSPVVKISPFNRTMRLPETYNLPPLEDGVHDPANEGISALHIPLEKFADLPRRNTGNRVDWVAALNDKKITPLWDRDGKAEGMVMDMDIVRVPKGTMPNVVFPHKQHTEWLACANCHPAIFVPQKGANQISMRLILSGEKCGVCHGKVAFPPSECRLCHSRKKELPQEVVGAP